MDAGAARRAGHDARLARRSQGAAQRHPGAGAHSGAVDHAEHRIHDGAAGICRLRGCRPGRSSGHRDRSSARLWLACGRAGDIRRQGLRELPWLGAASGLQIPVTALLVVALGNGYGGARVLNTAVGGAIGIAVSALLLPPVRGPYAASGLAGLGDDVAAILRDAADGLSESWGLASARSWLRRSRDLESDFADVRDRLTESARSRRWNPQARRRHDYLPTLKDVELASPGSRHDRLVASLLENPRRLLDEMSPDGPHGAALDWAGNHEG